MIETEEKIDANVNTKIGGARKDDAGKVPLYRGGLAYFPKAISQVAACSAYGATVYDWEGWRHVDDGLNRYTDAMVRHLIEEAKGEVLDPDSGLPHAWHTAWNALARGELLIRQETK